jgi:hypothetical protein
VPMAPETTPWGNSSQSVTGMVNVTPPGSTEPSQQHCRRSGSYQAAPGGFGAGPHGGPPRVPCLPT